MRWDLAKPLAIWCIVIPFVHGIVPWMLSLLTLRLGWAGGAPGGWNLPGLVAVGAAAGWLVYAFWWRRRQIRASGISGSPDKNGTVTNPAARAGDLLCGGPYRLSRNPIYVGYLGAWLGWGWFFGSVPVFIGFAVLCTIAARLIVPAEERSLDSRFGAVYTTYKRRVRRWL